MRILVTGGAGFIGTAVVDHFFGQGAHVVNLDKFTYAAATAPDAASSQPRPGFVLEIADVADRESVDGVLRRHRPDAVVHLAGGTHVDRSIDRPDIFVRENIVGTLTLLEAARSYWQQLDPEPRARFRFLNISTAEVFGSLAHGERAHEATPYHPASPYAASKASGDHLMEAWFRTYGMPVITTRCSNNYGPRQFPEKLIPLMILNALEGRPLPIYGTGTNVRDWLYVGDHAAALWQVLNDGTPGASYNIGGGAVCSNIKLVRMLCAILDEALPDSPHRPHADLITFVADRPGHDSWNAVDSGLITRTLGWQPRETLESGLRRTVAWYLEHPEWWQPIRERVYRGERLGVGLPRQAVDER
jgi:dTDP-glucose 4,6-dehydratase